MTNKEILELLIPHYEKCIEEYKKNGDWNVIYDAKCYDGVCYLIQVRFCIIEPYIERFWQAIIRPHITNKGYWCGHPSSMLAFHLNVQRLEHRLNILKQEYAKIQ